MVVIGNIVYMNKVMWKRENGVMNNFEKFKRKFLVIIVFFLVSVLKVLMVRKFKFLVNLLFL